MNEVTVSVQPANPALEKFLFLTRGMRAEVVTENELSQEDSARVANFLSPKAMQTASIDNLLHELSLGEKIQAIRQKANEKTPSPNTPKLK